NLAVERSAQAEELRRPLQAALSRKVPAAGAAATVDSETAERLQALGYVGGGRTQPAGPGRRDPKDGIRVMPALNRGMSAARTDPAAAIRDLTAVLAEDPG